jgi:hypothetical protein
MLRSWRLDFLVYDPDTEQGQSSSALNAASRPHDRVPPPISQLWGKPSRFLPDFDLLLNWEIKWFPELIAEGSGFSPHWRTRNNAGGD